MRRQGSSLKLCDIESQLDACLRKHDGLWGWAYLDEKASGKIHGYRDAILSLNHDERHRLLHRNAESHGLQRRPLGPLAASLGAFMDRGFSSFVCGSATGAEIGGDGGGEELTLPATSLSSRTFA